MRLHHCLLVTCLALATSVGTAFPDKCLVELDINGVVGDAPDTLDILDVDTVKVDVWFLGSLVYELQESELVLCDGQPGPGPLSLRYAWCRLGWPYAWHFEELEDGCAWLYLHNGGHPSEGADIPALVASFVFNVSGLSGVTPIDVDTDRSYYDADFGDLPFDGATGLVIRSAPTSVSRSAWGTIKGLFR